MITEAKARDTVLIVDDSPDALRMLTDALDGAGMTVMVALDGASALRIGEQIVPDIILLDAVMPGMDGYDTMRAIRAMPDSRALPIVALTAKAMKGDREKCLEAGASDYLAKPVVTDQLLGVLRQWLHR